MIKVFAFAALFLTPAFSAEIRVMTSGAFTAAYLELSAPFERTSSHRLVTVTTTMGTGAASIPSRLQRGDPADVVIMADDSLGQLIQQGLVRAGSRTPLAKSAIGIAVRAGAPKPDISTPAALKQALLNASSIAYSASVSGTYLSTELLQTLGIAEAVLPKCKRIDRERVGAVVARGDAELGVQQISELLPIAGIDFVGPLPDPLQRVTLFSAGIPTGSLHPNAARQLIAFLAAPANTPVLIRTGLQALSPAAYLPYLPRNPANVLRNPSFKSSWISQKIVGISPRSNGNWVPFFAVRITSFPKALAYPTS